jgi:hypothetical protein
MNYSSDPSMVRVDFFKPSGKWYATEAVKWKSYEAKDRRIYEAFREALIMHLRQDDGTIRLAGMTAVCQDPYHENAHPQMTIVPSGLPVYVGRATCGGCAERSGKPNNRVVPAWDGELWVCPECNNNLMHQSEETAHGVWRELP